MLYCYATSLLWAHLSHYRNICWLVTEATSTVDS